MRTGDHEMIAIEAHQQVAPPLAVSISEESHSRRDCSNTLQERRACLFRLCTCVSNLRRGWP
jgi:hypothetical protein